VIRILVPASCDTFRGYHIKQFKVAVTRKSTAILNASSAESHYLYNIVSDITLIETDCIPVRIAKVVSRHSVNCTN